jgi:hypothetical protein
MDISQKTITKLNEDQQYLMQMQQQLYENMNILVENQINRVENLDIVIQNQSRIIHNQDVIVHNQINIINNQKKIVDNQVTLSVILKTQERMLLLLEKLSGHNVDQEYIKELIENIIAETKAGYDAKIHDVTASK